MRRSRGWLGVCAVVVALAWPGASAAQAATPGGGGTFSLLSADSVQAGAATTVVFSYTAPTQAAAPFVLSPEDVTVTVSLPQGWTATASAAVSCRGGAAGCWVTSQSGTQIVVGMSLGVAQTFTLDYPAMPPGSAGTFPFAATGAFGGAAPTSLPTLTVTVTCPDGAGMMSVDPGGMTAGQSMNLKFTYTAGSCGVEAGGEVAVIVPDSWPAPTSSSVTGSGNSTPAVSGSTITVPTGNLGPGASIAFYYDMARAPASAGGYTFDAFEQSSATGSLRALTISPEVMVTAAVATSSPSVSATGSPSVSATGSPSVSATGSPSVSATGGDTAPPASAGGLPIALVGFGLGALGLLGLVVAAGIGGLLASRRSRRGGHGTAGENVRAVPRTGPPPSVAVHYTGNRPALTVRIEPRAGAAVTTIEEIRP